MEWAEGVNKKKKFEWGKFCFLQCFHLSQIHGDNLTFHNVTVRGSTISTVHTEFINLCNKTASLILIPISGTGILNEIRPFTVTSLMVLVGIEDEQEHIRTC